MIHEMEVEGITVVRTPLTQYIYDTEGMEGLRKLDDRFPGYSSIQSAAYHKETQAAPSSGWRFTTSYFGH